MSYSYGKCADDPNGGWDIREDVVIEFAFTPLTNFKLSSLKLNLRKFKRIHESPHAPEIITYVNKQAGIRYVVQANGLLSTIGFFPSSKYNKLRCRSNRRPALNRSVAILGRILTFRETPYSLFAHPDVPPDSGEIF